MRVGQVVDVRGVAYLVTRILPDGEPCLRRLATGGPCEGRLPPSMSGCVIRVPGGGMLGAQ